MNKRIFQHAMKLYRKKFKFIVLFSIPFVAAFLITMLVSAPSYLAVGSMFIRTGSLPELGVLDMILTTLGYIISIFIVSVVITNLNLLIKEKRTQTLRKTEVIKSIKKYTIKIFILLILLKLIIVILQLGTYGMENQSIVYPILLGLASIAFFYIPPAIVIDERDTFHALSTSINLVIRKPILILGWIVFGMILISITQLILFLIAGPTYGAYLTMLGNSLFILPFLIILQSHMYMERYPLAR